MKKQSDFKEMDKTMTVFILVYDNDNGCGSDEYIAVYRNKTDALKQMNESNKSCYESRKLYSIIEEKI